MDTSLRSVHRNLLMPTLPGVLLPARILRLIQPNTFAHCVARMPSPYAYSQKEVWHSRVCIKSEQYCVIRGGTLPFTVWQQIHSLEHAGETPSLHVKSWVELTDRRIEECVRTDATHVMYSVKMNVFDRIGELPFACRTEVVTPRVQKSYQWDRVTRREAKGDTKGDTKGEAEKGNGQLLQEADVPVALKAAFAFVEKELA
jgi:hypothetical protein